MTVKTFKDTMLQPVRDGTVKSLRTFHLTDDAEQKDPTCKMLFGYGRSLLYLVSESFEHGVQTPILGMQEYFSRSIGALDLPNVQAFVAPGASTASTTHGGFDDDTTTMRSVISLIKAGALSA